MAPEKITIIVDGDAKDYVAATVEARAATKALGSETRKQNREQQAADVMGRRLAGTLGGLGHEAQGAAAGTDRLNLSIGRANRNFRFFQNAIKLLKWPAMIAGAGQAAAAIGALGGGVAALAGSLAPAIGLLTQYGTALGVIGQVGAVGALAGVSSLAHAVGGLNQQIDKSSVYWKRLSPSAQHFAEQLQRMKQPLLGLQHAVQQKLFAGLSRSLTEAEKNLPTFQHVLVGTTSVLGRLADRFGRFIGSKGFARDFRKIGDENNRVLSRMGRAALQLGHALTDVMVAARPLTEWLSKLALGWAKNVAGAAQQARKTGELNRFFHQTEQVTSRLLSIFGHVAKALWNIISLGKPLGDSILKNLDSSAAAFERWTESTRGRNEIAQYFREIKPPLFEMGRLVAEVVKSFFTLSRSEGLTTILREIRTGLLPALTQTVQSTSAAFGPNLVRLLTHVAELIARLAGSSGPLTLYVDLLDRAVRLLNRLFDAIPGLQSGVVTLLGFASVIKALKFSGAISGVSALTQGFRRLTTSAEAAAAAERSAATAAAGPVTAGGRGLMGPAGGLAPTTVPTGRFKSLGTKAARAFNAGWSAFGWQALGLTIFAGLTTKGGIIDDIRGKGADLGNALADAIVKAAGPKIRHGLANLRLRGVENLNDDMRKVIGAFKQAGIDVPKNLQRLVDATGRDVDKLKEQYGDWRNAIMRVRHTNFTSLDDIADHTREALQKINQIQGISNERREQLVQNSYSAEVRAIRRAMNQGEVAVRKGNRRIVEILERQLHAMGVNKTAAKVIAVSMSKGGAGPSQGFVHRQTGGYVVPGEGSGDKVPLHVGGRHVADVEPKEGVYVANRDLMAWLERANAAVPRNAGGLIRRQSGGPVKLAAGGMAAMVAAANRIDAHHYPYRLGGGHSGFVMEPFDCSGAVSYVLHAGGLLNHPEVSGQLMSWGRPGKGPVTVWASPAHTVMALNGRVFGTSSAFNPGGGAGWIDEVHGAGGSLVSGGVARTMPVSGGRLVGSIRLPRFGAYYPGFIPHAARLNQQSMALEILANRALQFMGGGGGQAAVGGWRRVGATYEGLDGAMGAYGRVGGLGFAELLVAGANAGLWRQDLAATLGLPNKPGVGMPPHTKLAFRMPGARKSAWAEKNDIGSGQAGNPHYKVDIQTGLMRAIGWHPNEDVEVAAAQAGGAILKLAAGGAARNGKGKPAISADDVRTGLEHLSVANLVRLISHDLRRAGHPELKAAALKELRDRVHEAEKGVPIRPFGRLHELTERLKVLELTAELHPMAKGPERAINTFLKANAVEMVRDLSHRRREWRQLRIKKERAEHTPSPTDDAEIAKQIAKFLGKKPGRRSATQAQLIEILRTQVANLERALALETSLGPMVGQFAALPYLGPFLHGTRRVRETGLALLHRGETVEPDPRGPFGSQVRAPAAAAPGPVELRLVVAEDPRQLVRVIDARIDGKRAQIVRETDRRLGRTYRQLATAPGGGR